MRRTIRGEDGQAMVEFALVLPLNALNVPGTIFQTAMRFDLNAIATIVDEKLLEIEARLTMFERSRPVMIRLEDDLSDDEKHAVLNGLAEMRRTLHSFNEKYALSGLEKRSRREVNIIAAFLWEDLASVLDKRMQGYGEMDEAKLTHCLSYIEELAASTRKIVESTY